MRIGRVRAAFIQMMTINIKIRTFNTTVKPVLLLGALKAWRTTAVTLKKI